MVNQPRARRSRVLSWAGLCFATVAMVAGPTAMAACRVTDFTDRSLSSLTEIQRLSFASQMTQTEFATFKAAAPGSANYYPLIVKSATLGEAKQAARAKLDSLKIENGDYYAKFWASDFLTDEKLRAFVTCSSSRRPGIVYAGRPDGASKFNLSFTHLTPVGVEKITMRVIASHNIANIDEFEAFLNNLGEQNNFAVQTFALRRTNPTKPAVVFIRAGYETPLPIYIPVYPAPEVRP